ASTALILAASTNQIDIVEALLRKKADLRPKDDRGRTALFAATEGRADDSFKLLIDAGADVNDYIQNESSYDNGYTLLMSASSHLSTANVGLLIDRGLDVNAKTRNGWTALMLAPLSKTPDNLKLLLDKGADVNAKANGSSPTYLGGTDVTALQVAAAYGSPEM